MYIAKDQPNKNSMMAELARPVLEPLHMEPWALAIKKGMGIDKEEFDAFAVLMTGVVGYAIEKKLKESNG